MEEMQLINILSYLEPELLDNNYIENDMSRFTSIINKITNNSNSSFKLGLSSTFKIIALISTGVVVTIGAVVLIIKKKKGFNLPNKKLNLPRKMAKLVAN